MSNAVDGVGAKAASTATLLCLLALIALCLSWELWLAPLRPGGSWLVLKALPLLAPLRGILGNRRYTYKWSTFLALAYFTEGVVRAVAEHGTSRKLAMLELALSMAFYASAIAFVRLTRPSTPLMGESQR
ncbi:MAG TPA: DUF2069 domain-containing protein [Burkholderiales bacterium]|nr:DUF2069 domain-containing protein [Burkholderiales bacterium]